MVISASAAACLLVVSLSLQAAAAPTALSAATSGDGDAVVRITAVVTDAKGRPVNGLKTADFDLRVDGTPHALDRVEVSDGRADGSRTFVFLLDEFHVTPEHSAVVRESLLKFVDQHIRGGDEALVLKPLDSLRDLTPTGARAAIRDAISTFEGRKGDYTPRTAFERNYMAQAPSAVAAARAQIVTAALRAVGMQAVERGRGALAIVLVSDGFARMRSSREVPANLQTAIRIANRADAPIYAFAPALSSPPPDDSKPDPAYTALAALTGQTGGELVTGAESLDAGLSRMVRDLDSHYVLTYRPTHGNDGRFHAVEIGVKRDAAQVRARTGYMAPPSEQTRAAAIRAASAPNRVLRRSALIQSWSGLAPTAGGKTRVVISWEPAPPRPGSTPRGRAASVLISASTPDGTMLFDGAVAPVGSSEHADHARFEAPVGPVQIDMKILDQKGVVIDTDARDIVVAAPRAAGPTIYPPAVLRTRSAREFREVSSNPDATPAPAREFRRTERLLVRVPAITASGDQAEVRAVLLNRMRQPIRDLQAVQGVQIPGATQFDLPLAPLVPGNYSLRLSVDGPNGGVSEYVSFTVGG